MYMTILKAEMLAIKSIETAFIDAGWSDGSAMTDAKIRKAKEPIFYKDSTPKVAADAVVTVDGIGRKLYCIYNIIAPRTATSGNKSHHIEITVALAIYTDTQYLFAENSKHAKYIDALLDELAKEDWIISSAGADESVASQDEQSPYIYRKTLYATNVF